jgi:hypothetical protein
MNLIEDIAQDSSSRIAAGYEILRNSGWSLRREEFLGVFARALRKRDATSCLLTWIYGRYGWRSCRDPSKTMHLSKNFTDRYYSTFRPSFWTHLQSVILPTKRDRGSRQTLANINEYQTIVSATDWQRAPTHRSPTAPVKWVPPGGVFSSSHPESTQKSK